MYIEGRYVDLVLCRDEENAPVLAIGPRWSVAQSDLVDAEIDGKIYTLRVEHVCTVIAGDNIYEFVSSAYGDDPQRVVIKKLYESRDLSWASYEEPEEKEETE